MRNQLRISTFLVIMFVLTFFYSCTKKERPVVPTVPILSTNPVISITTTGASISGHLTSNGKTIITSVGICWGTAPIPTINSNKITATLGTDSSFSVNLRELKSGTLYYVRAFAVNSVGINYGNQITFKTEGNLPEATTELVSKMMGDTAILGGKVSPNHLSTTVSFEYGTTTSYGNTSLALQSPISDGVNVDVTSEITGLLRNTTYHYRVKAENSIGAVYGKDKTFRLSDPDGTIGTVTDIDGNTYKSIVIGSQIWMMENLQTTKCNDGTLIPNVTDNVQWPKLSTPAYCWYGNHEGIYKATPHGALYNWFAVSTGKLAPLGWHVSSQEDWNVLIDYLGGPELAGGKMKEVGLLHWLNPNTGANNSSGFTALASGARFDSGFTFFGQDGYWWTTTSSNSTEYAFYHYLDYNASNIDTYNTLNYKVKGFSVRCIKD